MHAETIVTPSATQRTVTTTDPVYLHRELWTVKEAGDFLRRKKSALYEMFADGTLPRVKLGGATYIPAAACRAMVAAAVAAAEADAAARRVTK